MSLFDPRPLQMRITKLVGHPVPDHAVIPVRVVRQALRFTSSCNQLDWCALYDLEPVEVEKSGRGNTVYVLMRDVIQLYADGRFAHGQARRSSIRASHKAATPRELDNFIYDLETLAAPTLDFSINTRFEVSRVQFALGVSRNVAGPKWAQKRELPYEVVPSPNGNPTTTVRIADVVVAFDRGLLSHCRMPDRPCVTLEKETFNRYGSLMYPLECFTFTPALPGYVPTPDPYDYGVLKHRLGKELYAYAALDEPPVPGDQFIAEDTTPFDRKPDYIRQQREEALQEQIKRWEETDFN